MSNIRPPEAAADAAAAAAASTETQMQTLSLRYAEQIHAEGGRYIGRALRSNRSLVNLNLRLNRLTDEGGRMLIEGLHDNPTLVCLNLRYVRR